MTVTGHTALSIKVHLRFIWSSQNRKEFHIFEGKKLRLTMVYGQGRPRSDKNLSAHTQNHKGISLEVAFWKKKKNQSQTFPLMLINVEYVTVTCLYSE